MRNWSAVGVAVLTGFTAALLAQAPKVSLEDGFRSPSVESRPLTWWHWINGNVSREGIRADLEDMKRAGLGGLQLVDVAMYLPPGPVRYHSAEWYDDVEYAIETAHGLGLSFGVANSAGWSGSGGPWVTPAMAMQHVVWTETEVAGGKDVRVALPQVLAVPAEETEAKPASVEASPKDFFERGSNAAKTFAAKAEASVTFRYAEPVERRTLEIHCAQRSCAGSFHFELLASDDGVSFRSVWTSHLFGESMSRSLFAAFPPTTAKVFRVRVANAIEKLPQLDALMLSDHARVENVEGKTLNASMMPLLTSMPLRNEDPGAIAAAKVVDLTTQMRSDGTLVWIAPPGRWTVLRMGYAPVGTTNHPPQPEGSGLEIDKMSAAVTDVHFEKAVGGIVDRAGALAGTTLTQLLIDSWESGSQNWTAGLPDTFRRLRGYELRKYLPVLTGRVVGSPAESEAFLRDFRHTISEMVTENYYGEFARLAHRHGMKLYAEAYPGPMFNMDEAAAKADVPMTEFWAPTGPGYMVSQKRVGSVAHEVDKDVVAAEAFTGAPEQSGWMWTPETLKPIGDSAFASGINQFVLHAYVHQPEGNVRPGWTMGRYGTQFGRGELWWEAGAQEWLTYLARSQFLLQQGHAVADVLALRTEDVDGVRDVPAPKLPLGVDYEWADVRPLLRARVSDGAIEMEHEGPFRVLVLPEIWTADLPVLEKVAEASKSGVSVYGSEPLAPSSMEGFQQQARWSAEVAALWDGHATVHVQRADVLQRGLPQGVERDVEIRMEDGGLAPIWLHRRTVEGDVYFVANPQPTAVRFRARFHSGKLAPELWDAMSGTHANAVMYRAVDGGVEMQMELSAGESTFVVFRRPLPTRNLTELSDAQGKSLPVEETRVARSGAYTMLWSDGARERMQISLPDGVELMRGWDVEFRPAQGTMFSRKFEGLHDWALDPDAQIRVFSGTAVYRKTLSVSAKDLEKNGAVLELGDVQNVAAVSVNGKQVATLWAAPFRCDVTRWLKPGENRIEVAVTDRWVNRMIGDEALPADSRYAMDDPSEFKRGRLAELPPWYGDAAHTAARQRSTWASWQHFSKESKPVSAGLIGPVRLNFVRSLSADR
jgi:hypothetical protein